MRPFRALFIFLALPLCPPSHAADQTRPNILFAIADDWSYGHAGAYGCKWVKTPAFDRVARDGVLFNNAFVPNNKCAPSRSVILTGRNPWQLKEAANHICFFPAEFMTYPEALEKAGYFVGATGKGWGPGIAKDAEKKKRDMVGKFYRGKKTNYAANFADFLKETSKEKPWCFWYGGYEPHRPYKYGLGLKSGKKITDIDKVPSYWPDNETVRTDMLDYAQEVEHFDSHLERMLKMLEEKGMLENTIVIVTSDNSMPFPRCKGQMYYQCVRMPLAIMWKKGIKTPGRVVNDFVSFTDFAPTLIDIAGIPWNKTGMSPAAGKSFRDILESDQAGRVTPSRDHVLIGKERQDVGRPNDWGYPIRGIVKDDFIYLRNYEPDRWPAGNPEAGYRETDSGPTKTEILNARREHGKDTHWDLCFGKYPAEQLFNTKNDPECLNNLAGNPSYSKQKKALSEQMVKELTEQGDPRMMGKGEIFEQYPYAHADRRNFYNRFIKGNEPFPAKSSIEDSDYEKTPLN